MLQKARCESCEGVEYGEKGKSELELWQGARGKQEADLANRVNLSKPVDFHQVEGIPDGIRLAQRFVPPPHWSVL